VRKISSLRRVVDMPYICNNRGKWAGNMSKGECCSSFGKCIRHFITGKSSVTGTHWKLRATWKEREPERFQISQKDFDWRNAGFVERRVRADWESVKKRAD